MDVFGQIAHHLRISCSLQRYYHYTTAEGASGIQDSKVIYASDADGPKADAYFGNGESP